MSRMGWMRVCVLAAGVGVASAGEDPFTASPARRADARARVRAAEREREEVKKTGPAAIIVKDGQPVARIVSETNSAALLLQEWIRLMSGATLPIVPAAEGETPRIYVGKAAVAAGLSLDDLRSRTGEGWRIRCDGTSVWIAAQSEAATVRAVGRFLEEQFGCRWFADTDWGRHYPSEPTLAVAKGEWTEAPASFYRRMWGAEGAFQNKSWLLWNGDGGTAIPMSHSWGFLTREDFDRHPEWFRLDETGQRVFGPWYNIGHPEVRRRFMEWALKASDNGRKAISFSLPDDHREDFSPESRAYDNPGIVEPSSGRISMTDRFLSPINEAARRLYELDPGPIHGFYAYSDYTLPPTRPELQTLSPNLSVWIAPIRFSRYHPLGHPNSPSCQRLKDIVDGWSKTGALIGWRTYNFNLAEMMTPYSRLSIWAHDMPYLHAKGAIGFNLESANAWELYAPFLYQSLRLAYDPRLDPWVLMADYWDKAYGPAAEPMEAYWMNVDAAVIGLKTETGSRHALHHLYTPVRLAELDGLMDEAERLAGAGGTTNQQYRVALARRGLTRAFHWRRWYDAMNGGDIEGARAAYDAWYACVQETIGKKQGNAYEERYLRRFVGSVMNAAYAAVHPSNAPANRVVAVLPDLWKTATADELAGKTGAANPWDEAYDDTGWKTLRTFTDTRNAQGFPEYFGDLWYRTSFQAPASRRDLLLHFWKADRKVTLYVNGRQVNPEEQEAFAGTTIDVTGFVIPGETNRIAVKVRHLAGTELYLGGLVEPLYLIEKGP